MCGVTTNFALASALLNANVRGIFMDATWRGMNQNYAPVTFLLGVDEFQHATPFAVLISQDIQAVTLEQFLTAWKKGLQKFAQSVISGSTDLPNRTEEQKHLILKSAHQVVKSKWNPAFCMIDKDTAERNACQKAFPDVEVRVCQFHIIQAIQRWLDAVHTLPSSQTGKTGRKQAKGKNFHVPKECHDSILRAFRYTQRCRSSEAFTSARTAFEASIKKICEEHDIVVGYNLICAYFADNFWNETWRSSVTDIGLPLGTARDNICNTNNFSESMIKTFKYIFLGMRKNKRVDTLVITIVELFFPYYQFWQDNRIRHAQDYIASTQAAYDMWQSSSVTKSKISTAESYTVNDFTGQNRRRYEVSWPSNPSCTCTKFGQTGKFCQHLWATSIYGTYGAFTVWADSTNDRINDRSMKVEFLIRGVMDDTKAPNDEPPIPIDAKFPSLVQQWGGLDTEHAREENLLVDKASSSPSESLPHSPDDTCAIQSSPHAATPLPPIPINEDANPKFTPDPKNMGGRKSRQSPIRPFKKKRTYSEVTKSVPAGTPTSPPQSSPTAPVFRRLRSKFGKAPRLEERDILPQSQFATVSVPIPAPVDDQDAQLLEDLERMHGNFDTWDSPQYQLRHEEGNLVADMLSQMSKTLRLGALVFADQGDTLKEEWEDLDLSGIETRSQFMAHVPPGGWLSQLLEQALEQQPLKHLVVLYLRNHHWSLVHFKAEDQCIVMIDSIRPLKGTRSPNIENLEMFQELVGYLFSDLGVPKLDTSAWDLHQINTGHQPTNQHTGEVQNLSCGFWASIYATHAVFNAPIKDVLQLASVVDSLRSMVIEYRFGTSGGLSQDTVMACLNMFIPTLRSQLIQYEGIPLWAPFRFQEAKTSKPSDLPATPPTEVVSPEVGYFPRAMAHDEQLKLDKEFHSRLDTKYRQGKLTLPHSHFQTLRPTNWVSSAALDFVCGALTNETKGLWALSTAFMPYLADGYGKASRFQPYGQRQKGALRILQDIPTIFIPFNEPIVKFSKLPPVTAGAKASNMESGMHWASIIIQTSSKQVRYQSSLKNPKHADEAMTYIKTYLTGLGSKHQPDKGLYNEVDWNFTIDESTPQQENSYDCGGHVLSYLVGAALNCNLEWSSQAIKILRLRIAYQILDGQLNLDNLVVELAEEQALVTSQYVAVTPRPPPKRRIISPSSSPEEVKPAQDHTTGSHSPIQRKPAAKKARVVSVPLAPAPFKLAGKSKPKSAKPLSAQAQKSIFAKADALLNYNPDQSDEDLGSDHLCPFCNAEIPSHFKEEFEKELKSYLPLSRKSTLASNNKNSRVALPGQLTKVSGFCLWHKETLRTAEIQATGHSWPSSIPASSLRQRVQKLASVLEEIALDPSEGFAYEPVMQMWVTYGRGYCLGAKGMFEAAGIWGTAYYGDDGVTIIFETLMQLLQSNKITFQWENWGGMDDTSFALQNVLIPECLLELIMEDNGVGREEGLELMEESKEFGRLGNTVLK